MKLFRQIIAPFAFAAFVSACGGGEKKADEPAPPNDGADSTGETAETADPTGEGNTPPPAEDAPGDEFDSDPLPNPCKGDGN